MATMRGVGSEPKSIVFSSKRMSSQLRGGAFRNQARRRFSLCLIVSDINST
jgi:hypothetical protein